METDSEDYKNIEQVTRQLKPAKGLVEEAFQMKIGHFGKRLLFSVKRIEDVLGIGQDSVREGKKGEIIVKAPRGQGELRISYQVDLIGESPALELSFVRNPLSFEQSIAQRVDLETQELAWGTRYYFVCDCGKRCNILYLASGRQTFGCRECQNLTYEIRRINKRSMNGLLYYLNRKLRLADKREKIDRISYDGKRTKKFERFTRLYSRLEKMEHNLAGLTGNGSVR